MTFDEWIRIGLERGFAGPPVCCNHENVPMSRDEWEEPDRCFLIVRIYDTDEERYAVERDHQPSIDNRAIYL